MIIRFRFGESPSDPDDLGLFKNRTAASRAPRKSTVQLRGCGDEWESSLQWVGILPVADCGKPPTSLNPHSFDIGWKGGWTLRGRTW